jgi:hypothetical protein
MQDIKAYYALLRSATTDTFALHVLETGCDACAAAFRQIARSSGSTGGLRLGGWVPSTSSSRSTTLPSIPKEAVMPEKCVSCGIRLDVPCTNPACAGHHNESLGEVCVYCATNERENRRFVRELPTLFPSSLYTIAYGEDGEDELDSIEC